MSEPRTPPKPAVVNPDLFARPAFQQHFRQAHAENVARHLPRPTPAPEPAPRMGRQTHDTRRNYRPSLVYGALCT